MSEREGLAPACVDVLIAGAGPAGAELARLLAEAGTSVLLVDPLTDLRRAAFSSAALPLAAVEHFGLPASVVASHWSRWLLLGPGLQRREWESSQEQPLGAVLDFGSLRQWLADQAVAAGAQVQLGWRAERTEQAAQGIRTELRSVTGERRWVQSQWLIDATGQQRALMGDPAPAHGPLVLGVGVEWWYSGFVPQGRGTRTAERQEASTWILRYPLQANWTPTKLPNTSRTALTTRRLRRT